MDNDFVKTQVTLLRQIAMEKTGEDETQWARFFDLYYPAIEAFARRLGGGSHSEDIAQEVLVKLVKALREGRYERQEGGSFRRYVKTLVRNRLIDLYRSERTRGLGRKVDLNETVADTVVLEAEDVGDALDREWVRACYDAACEHVLTKTALSAQSRAIYRAYAIEGRDADSVAREFGIKRNSVCQVKSRVDRMIVAKLAECGT